MDLQTKKRFNRSIEHAISNLDSDAFCFGFMLDKEYRDFISGIKKYQDKLIEEIHAEEQRLKEQFEKEKKLNL